MSFRSGIACLLGLLVAGSGALAADWPQWRGLGRDALEVDQLVAETHTVRGRRAANPLGDIRTVNQHRGVGAGERHVDQHVFDAIFEVIRRAQRFVVIDMFLWNDFQGEVPETTRADQCACVGRSPVESRPRAAAHVPHCVQGPV